MCCQPTPLCCVPVPVCPCGPYKCPCPTVCVPCMPQLGVFTVSAPPPIPPTLTCAQYNMPTPAKFADPFCCDGKWIYDKSKPPGGASCCG